MKGIVMNIQRFCLHDGPGIRTTVFMKGCNMQCLWCHNPESIENHPELLYDENKCEKCGRCVLACPNGAHEIRRTESGYVHDIDRKKCLGCGRCVQNCVKDALEVAGREMSIQEVMTEIRKDHKYYADSGGGITVSGGESTYQAEFVEELLGECRQEGISTALETNGLMSSCLLHSLLPLTDLFLYDYKITGEEEHIKWTGVSGKTTLDNLRMIQENGGHVWLRCPVIPGINDTQEHFSAIRNLRKTYPCIEKAEIMPYHDTGKGKWKKCGKEYSLSHIKTVDAGQKRQWQACIDES